MKDENVLKQPKKPTEKNNNKFLLVTLNDMKIPNKNEAKTLTIRVLFKENNLLLSERYFINILKKRPKVLPNKI